MNANIFSCTVPLLLVLETQIIHPELLQSLCTTHWDPFFWQMYARRRKRLWARADGCTHAQTGKGAHRCLRPHAPVYARPYHLHTCVPVYAHPYPFAPARTLIHLRASSPVCARPLASARALHQRGFRFDTSASLKLSTVKKEMVKKFLHADVRLKRTGGQVCSSICVLNRRPNLHVRLVRQPC